MKNQLKKTVLVATLVLTSLGFAGSAQAFFMYNDFMNGYSNRPIFCKYVPTHRDHHRLYPGHTSCFVVHGYGHCGCRFVDSCGVKGGYYYPSERVLVSYDD